METLVTALQEVENIPAYLPNCLQLQDVLDKAKDWLQEAEALQVTHIPARSARCVVVFYLPISECLCFQLGGRIPVLDNLSELVLRAEAIPVRLDPLSRLEALVCDIQTWKESAGKTFLLKNSPFSLLEVSSW